jgi:hypothetical protein
VPADEGDVFAAPDRKPELPVDRDDERRTATPMLLMSPGYTAAVIVWVSSFPRSGNTFLRIVLRNLYGVRTSVVYDVDGVAERLGAEAVGFIERPRRSR